nr:ComEC/Rec2 family competence protein [Pararhizobium antarcticum]
MPAISRAIAEEQAYGHAFLFIPVFIGAGALTWFALAEQPGLYKLALLLCVSGMAAILLRHARTVWRLGSRLVACFVAGMLLAALETQRLDTVLLDTPVTTLVRGTVIGREATDRGHWRYIVAVTQTSDPRLKRPPDKVSLLSRSREAAIAIGRTIEGRARLSPPSGPALPGLNDFAFDSYFKGIGAVGYFYGTPHAVTAAEARVNGAAVALRGRITEEIARWREAIGTRIRTTIGGDAGAIAAALVTAEERAISRDTIDVLRQAGLAHVLAISGLNMVLAAGTFLIGARTLLCLVPGLAQRVAIKKIAATGALVMVFAYILISGGAVSAVRSWIMISIMLVAVFFDRPSISLRNVALSAIVILLVNPSAVTGPGFQMSFAATLALVAGYAHWRDRKLEERPLVIPGAGGLRFVSGFFGGLFLSSLIGGLSTMIYSAGHFHRLAAYGLAGNIMAMPVISVLVMPFALIAMMLMPLGLDRYPLLIMGQGIEWMIAMARIVAGWQGDITTGRLPESAVLLIAAGGVFLCLFRTRLAAGGLIVMTAGVVVLLVQSTSMPALVISEDGRLVAAIEGARASVNRQKPPDFIFAQWQRALDLDDHRPPVQRADLAQADTEQAEKAKADKPYADPPPILSPGVGNRRAPKPPIDVVAAKTSIRRALLESPAGRFGCAPKQWCAMTTREGWLVVAVEDARFVGAACDTADIVVTPVMLRFSTCRTGARLISGKSLRRSGALEIYASDDVTTGSGQGTTGMRIVEAVGGATRAWERHRLYDWRTGAFVPVLPAD